ncbi:MAG TPA: M28 family peptidase [Bryobacteraceae bacterium]|jgi:glutaminyl-peptide cyclotransferase|nr:M28 family peptidase [Bryobacteraceae bacterium]
MRAIAAIFLFPLMGAAASFSGAAALDFARHAVSFGPRPPGSEANQKLEAYIVSQLKLDGCEVSEDPFTAQTPKGPIAMKNVIGKFPGKSGRAIVITGHFDTKLFPGRRFVGANDGGSSTGLLLELGRVLARQPRKDDVYLVFFDGEEAIREQWEGEDNLYGSRHLAERWNKDGTLRRIIALINVDMIGDRNLGIKQDTNSDARLRKLIWSAASQLGYAAYFVDGTISEEDDHIPFVKLGVPAVDVIDVDYPAWHTDNDTLDKISAQSLEVVGAVIADVIHRLEQQ